MDSAHPVSPLDVVPLLLKQVSNQKIYVVMHMTGRLNPNYVQTSLLLMAEQHPLLRHRLANNGGMPGWVPHETDFRLQCFSGGATDADDTAVRKHVCESQADRNGLLHVFIMHGRTRDSLCLSVDHTLTDAAGAKAVAYELLANYAQLATGSFPIPKMPLWRNSFSSLKTQLSLMKRIDAAMRWRPAPGRWTMKPAMSSTVAASTNSADEASPVPVPTYLLRHIDTAPVPRLKQKLRPYSATINDLLLASLFRSMAYLHDTPSDAKLPVQLTVDLRRHLPAEQRLCVANLSGSAHVYLSGNARKRFSQVLADTHVQTRQILQRNMALGGVLALDLLFKLSIHETIKILNRQFTASSKTRKANPLLANFGVLDFDHLNLDTTSIETAYMIGPSLLTPGLLISVSSCRNQLTISAGFDAATINCNYVHSILDLLSGHLSDVIFANSLI